MNRNLIKYFSLLLFICLTPLSGIAAQMNGDQRIQEISNQIADVKKEVKRNTDDIAIIRRDETNYSIEKNILEKTYSSNSEVIGKAVGFSFAVLGFVFSIVSAMGMKGVRELAREYEKKLESAQTLKVGLESGLALLDGTRKLIETEFSKKLEILEGEISNLRNNQNSKIQVLELTEKAGQAIHARNYRWAIENIKIGLGIDPEYEPLLLMHSQCEMKLGNFKAAIEIVKKIINTGQNAPSNKMDLAELYLLNKDFKEFDELMLQSQSEIGLMFDGNALPYLFTLKEIQMGNLAKAKDAIRPFVDSRPANETSMKMENFDFSDLNLIISKMKDESIKKFSEIFRNFFCASCTKEVMQQAINA